MKGGTNACVPWGQCVVLNRAIRRFISEDGDRVKVGEGLMQVESWDQNLKYNMIVL